jgi:hypothetical protein
LQPLLPPPADHAPLTGPRAELMKEMRAVQVRYQEIRAKVDNDPALLALRTAAEEAQKAYREKLQELMAKDPAYAEVKAKREELQAKMMAQMGARPEAGRLPVPPGIPGAPLPGGAPAPAPAPAPLHPPAAGQVGESPKP